MRMSLDVEWSALDHSWNRMCHKRKLPLASNDPETLKNE
jgi:hypothetical protein